jgi:hypothetical protein
MGDRPLVKYRGRTTPTWWKIGFNALTRMVLDAGRIEVLTPSTTATGRCPGA